MRTSGLALIAYHSSGNMTWRMVSTFSGISGDTGRGPFSQTASSSGGRRVDHVNPIAPSPRLHIKSRSPFASLYAGDLADTL